MKLNKIRNTCLAVVALSLSMSMTGLSDWQYTLYGPIAVWTNTTSGEQTTVYAGQPAPDGTPAPELTLTAPVVTKTDTASAIAAANAAADAAKAARGGNVTNVTTDADRAAESAAANANMNTNMVAVIDRTYTKGNASSQTNSELPMIQTSDQTAANSSGISDGTYVGPGNSVTAKISGTQGIQTGTYSYKVSEGHLVTNAESPEVGKSLSTGNTAAATTTNTTTGNTAAATTQNTSSSAPVTNNSSAVGYNGTLPSTGSNNIATYQTPGA